MKYLCLSFDDGPNPAGDNTMNNMLDLLEKNNVPASFFLIGNKITPENRKVIERAVKMGCDIQNHSWTHPAMAEMEDEAIKEEFKKCDDAIFEITGDRPQFFRPPYISVSDKMFDDIPLAFICGHGCRDWEPDFPAEERLKMMIEGTKDGTIFLLHVTEGNTATYEAVEKFIPMMKEQGYTFVNLPDLFKLENVNPNGKRECWTFLK
ncbi:MAG: polysaccharide deacetylase family protein [Treponema sp.]|nr:polysaccharide deacetylase family protein [Treponema sp.]